MAMIPPPSRKHSEIERKIHEALEAEKREVATDYIRLSSIGKCPRALWALRQGQPVERSPCAGPWGRALMTFDIGHHLEDAVIGWLNAAGYVVEEVNSDGEQFEMCMPGRIGVGHIDGMIQFGRPSAPDWKLLEIKTAKAKKFEELVNLESYAAWNPGYADQIQGYMGASHDTPGRMLDDCLVAVLCKDDSRLYTEMIRFAPAKYEALKDRARLALGDEIPDKPPEAKTQYCKFCKYCDVNKWCWSAMAGVEFDA